MDIEEVSRKRDQSYVLEAKITSALQHLQQKLDELTRENITMSPTMSSRKYRTLATGFMECTNVKALEQWFAQVYQVEGTMKYAFFRHPRDINKHVHLLYYKESHHDASLQFFAKDGVTCAADDPVKLSVGRLIGMRKAILILDNPAHILDMSKWQLLISDALTKYLKTEDK